MKKLTAFLAALALSTSFVVAQEEKPEGEKGKKGNPEELFKKLDANSDGSIDTTEFKESPMAKRAPEKADESFKRRDKDGDGKISLEEFKAGRGGKGEKKKDS